jgi:hypothetical protein
MTRFHATPNGNVPFTAEEEAEADAAVAAWEAGKDAREAEKVRAERNILLTASDWTQVTDSTADKTAWAAYRQDLRNISLQTNFPWDIVWPTQPL